MNNLIIFYIYKVKDASSHTGFKYLALVSLKGGEPGAIHPQKNLKNLAAWVKAEVKHKLSPDYFRVYFPKEPCMAGNKNGEAELLLKIEDDQILEFWEAYQDPNNTDRPM